MLNNRHITLSDIRATPSNYRAEMLVGCTYSQLISIGVYNQPKSADELSINQLLATRKNMLLGSTAGISEYSTDPAKLGIPVELAGNVIFEPSRGNGRIATQYIRQNSR